jgi:hypothetical protein
LRDEPVKFIEGEVMSYPSRTAVALAAISCLFLFCFTPLLAQNVPVSTVQLARTADVVAVGKVTGTRGEWDQTKSRIFTRVTVAVDEYLKGDAGREMTILAPGGEVDGVGEWYSHTARFKNDETVVVFAEKDRKGTYRISGGTSGKLSVTRDERTSQARVSDQTTLDDLKAQVNSAIRSADGN